MLEAVSVELPELLDFCALSYESESVLKFEDRQVLSREGVQQGDPLGPVLYLSDAAANPR